MSLVWKNTDAWPQTRQTPLGWSGAEIDICSSNITNTLQDEWANIPQKHSKILEDLPRRVENLIAAKGHHLHINICLLYRPCWCNGQVYQYYVHIVYIQRSPCWIKLKPESKKIKSLWICEICQCAVILYNTWRLKFSQLIIKSH